MAIIAQVTTIMGIGLVGPPGPPGPGNEVDVAYSRRVDWVSDTVLYKGEAAAGAVESDPVWRIHKITIGVDNDVTELWAGGVDTFTHAWTDRLTKVYS